MGEDSLAAEAVLFLHVGRHGIGGWMTYGGMRVREFDKTSLIEPVPEGDVYTYWPAHVVKWILLTL
jgi:hypothetical protein